MPCTSSSSCPCQSRLCVDCQRLPVTRTCGECRDPRATATTSSGQSCTAAGCSGGTAGQPQGTYSQPGAGHAVSTRCQPICNTPAWPGAACAGVSGAPTVPGLQQPSFAVSTVVSSQDKLKQPGLLAGRLLLVMCHHTHTHLAGHPMLSLQLIIARLAFACAVSGQSTQLQFVCNHSASGP